MAKVAKKTARRLSRRTFMIGLLIAALSFGALGAYYLSNSRALGETYVHVRDADWYDSTHSYKVTAKNVTISAANYDTVRALEVGIGGRLHMGIQGGKDLTPTSSCYILRAPDAAARVRLYSFGKIIETTIRKSSNWQEKCLTPGTSTMPGYFVKVISGSRVQVMERRDYLTATSYTTNY
jgi:hypothetical protein